jgi:hypothetical protein
LPPHLACGSRDPASGESSDLLHGNRHAQSSNRISGVTSLLSPVAQCWGATKTHEWKMKISSFRAMLRHPSLTEAVPCHVLEESIPVVIALCKKNGTCEPRSVVSRRVTLVETLARGSTLVVVTQACAFSTCSCWMYLLLTACANFRWCLCINSTMLQADCLSLM